MKTTPKIQVCLIEDNIDYRQTLSRVIKSFDGMACSGQFDSIEEAVDKFDAGLCPDVVLLDVGLPGVDGIDGMSQIFEIAPTTRVVMLTFSDEPEKIFRAICGQASGYLLKSSEPDEIEHAIRDVVAGGAPMTPKVARQVLELFSRHLGPKSNEEYALTPREHEVLELMAEGLTKKEIASRLAISTHTVHAHLRHIYEKLHVNTRAEAVAKAIRERLV